MPDGRNRRPGGSDKLAVASPAPEHNTPAVPYFEAWGQGCAAVGRLDAALLVWYHHCMEQGKLTEKNMTFRLPIALMERLRHLAEQHHRSLVGELLVAVEAYLHREERKAKRD